MEPFITSTVSLSPFFHATIKPADGKFFTYTRITGSSFTGNLISVFGLLLKNYSWSP